MGGLFRTCGTRKLLSQNVQLLMQPPESYGTMPSMTSYDKRDGRTRAEENNKNTIRYSYMRDSRDGIIKMATGAQASLRVRGMVRGRHRPTEFHAS